MSLARSFGLTSGDRGGSGGGASAGSRCTRTKGQRVRSCSRVGRFVSLIISSTSGAASLLAPPWKVAILCQGAGMQWLLESLSMPNGCSGSHGCNLGRSAGTNQSLSMTEDLFVQRGAPNPSYAATQKVSSRMQPSVSLVH